MTYGIDDLRRRLFETIDGVRSGAVSLDQARQISDLSQVIVNSAKVEVEYVKATEAAARSQFLEQPPAPPALPTLPKLPQGLLYPLQPFPENSAGAADIDPSEPFAAGPEHPTIVDAHTCAVD